DGRPFLELAGVDGGLDAAKIDLVELDGKGGVLEAALGQPPVQRHLTALKSLNPNARARGLALAAATASLAGARADAAPDARGLLAGARTVGEFVELHGSLSNHFCSTTRTRCWTLVIMPRVCGVSGSSATRPIRLSLRPIRVSRWLWWQRAGLAICSTLTVLPLLLLMSISQTPFIRRACRPRQPRPRATAAPIP